PPAVMPNGTHGSDDAVDYKRPFVWAHIFNDVDGDWVFMVGEAEVAHLVVTALWHIAQRGFGEIAVRVDQEKAIAAGGILRKEIKEEGRFSDAGRSQDRDVLQSLLGCKKDAGPRTGFCLANVAMRLHSPGRPRRQNAHAVESTLADCDAATGRDIEDAAL